MNRIEFQPSEHGGRLKYYRSTTTDSEHWDSLWDGELHDLDYSARLEGELPRHLKDVFHRWAPPTGSVLEAGCGLAGFTVAACALGYDAEGVDYAPRVVAMLNNRFPHVKFRQGDVTNLHDIADNSHDVVYSPGVCEHYEEGPELVLREACRVTKPGGILIVSTPCFNRFRQIIARFGAFKEPVTDGYFYQYALSPRDLSKVLESLGCSVLETRQYGTLKTIYDHFPFVPSLSESSLQRVSNNALGSRSSRKAKAIDSLPILRNWGHSGIWVARKS